MFHTKRLTLNYSNHYKNWKNPTKKYSIKSWKLHNKESTNKHFTTIKSHNINFIILTNARIITEDENYESHHLIKEITVEKYNSD